MADWNFVRFEATDRKLDKIVEQCRELESLIRNFVVTREIAAPAAQTMHQHQSFAFLEPSCSSENNFKGDAHKVFDGMLNRGNEDDRTLFVKIHLEYYVISPDVLNQVFSRIGELETIERLNHESQFHWKIRFQNRVLAFKAFESYDGRCIYDGCCRMELLLGRNSSGLNEAEIAIENVSRVEESQELDSFQKDSFQACQLEASIEDVGQENCDQSNSVELDGSSGQLRANSKQLIDEMKNCHEDGEAPKSEIIYEDSVAYKVYEEMPSREITLSKSCIKFEPLRLPQLLESRALVSNRIDCAGKSNYTMVDAELVFGPFDRGKLDFDGVPAFYVNRRFVAGLQEFLLLIFEVSGRIFNMSCNEKFMQETLLQRCDISGLEISDWCVGFMKRYVFDPGGVSTHARLHFDSSCTWVIMGTFQGWNELKWVFDPGGDMMFTGVWLNWVFDPGGDMISTGV